MKPMLGQAPLFPLPNGALIPGELLPLHVFEPRYRCMMEDVRRRNGIIAIGTLLSGWEAQYHESPPVAEIVGIGRVVKDHLKPDGTSDIVLHGMVRAEITAEVGGAPYRQARFVAHPQLDVHPADAYRLRRRLLAGLDERMGGSELRCDVTAVFDAGALVDRIAGLLRLHPEQRVAVLHAVDPDQRIDVLLELLDERRNARRLRRVIPSLGEFALFLEDAAP